MFKRNIMFGVAFCAASLTAFGSSAAAYRLVFTSQSQIVLIDPAEIRPGPKGHWRVWAVVVRRDFQINGTGIGRINVLSEADCDGRRQRSLSIAMYDLADRFLDLGPNKPTAWLQVIPGAYGAAMLQRVCSASWRQQPLDPLVPGEPGAIAAAIRKGPWPTTNRTPDASPRPWGRRRLSTLQPHAGGAGRA